MRGEILRPLRPVLLLVLAMGFTVSPAFAAKPITTVICKRLLSSEAKADFEYADWQDAYENARIEGNSLGGAYALSKMLIERGPMLGLSVRALHQLKAYSKALANPKLSHNPDITNPAPKKGLLKKAVDRLGLNPHPRVDSLGRITPVAEQAQLLAATFARDVLWSLGPFAYRVLPDWANRLFVGHMLKELQEKVFEPAKRQEVNTILHITDDPFLVEVEMSHFRPTGAKDVRKVIAQSQRGSVNRPGLIFTAALLANAVNYSVTGSPSFFGPYLGPFDSYGADPIPAYPGNQFLADSQKAVGVSIQGKKVTVIYDKDLIVDALPSVVKEHRKLFGGDIDPSQLIEAESIRSQSGDYQVIVVDSIESWSKALEAASDSDVVVVNAHGMPGYIGIGGVDATKDEHISQVREGVLKDGAVVIYTACSFGDVFGNKYNPNDFSDEYWVKLSSRMLGGHGYAVASTNTTLFTPLIVPTDKASLEQSAKLVAVQAVVGLALVPLGYIERSLINPEYNIEKLFGTPTSSRVFGVQGRGLRVYNAESKEVAYFLKD